ncbi:MAG: hypothetical protein H7330_10355 [Hymenobacteraceae bacterium]|nr:hypothetical protein [Hymenobacteraceae bacterium]
MTLFSAFLPRFSASRLRTLLLSGMVGFAMAACSTANEADTGTNQNYADDEATSRPTLPMPVATPTPAAASKKAKAVAVKPRRRVAPRPVARAVPKPSPKTIERLATQPRRQAQYSPMVERTSTGVRTTQDFSAQARSKQQRDNAAAVKTYKTQQNTRMARAYNNNNLLTR